MEANDLMIGDWVVFHDSGYASDGTVWKKDRVCQIDSIDTYVRVEWYDEDGCKEEWPNVSVMHLSPISLTPEILEKNGFVFMTGLWYLRTKERKPIQIVFKDNNVITLSINATPVPIGLKYVHQLQHALRLCGIEKEIEL